MVEVKQNDLDAIKLCAMDIIEHTPIENAFVGGTAIDILGILEKYIDCPKWSLVDEHEKKV